MRLGVVVLLTATVLPRCGRAATPTAASIQEELGALTVNPAQSFHVRELRIRRGDVSIYLNEGVLTFAQPLAGKTVAAIFTTEGSEGGDAEVILLPAQAAERASLASFAGAPNLDEHFDLAVLLFSDATAHELMAEIQNRALPPEPPPSLEHMNGSLQVKARQCTTPLVRTLLDKHAPQDGIFLATFIGRHIGTFDFIYQPESQEPVIVGANGTNGFQIWTAFRPRRMPAYVASSRRMDSYRIDGSIGEDLLLTATARFRFTADAGCGRTIPLELSPRLRVSSASIDGQPVEVLQSPTAPPQDHDSSASLLLVSGAELTAGRAYEVQIQYAGAVISRVSRSYFVGERTSWYPQIVPLLTTFDITLRCPDRFRLVTTGELLNESVTGRVRTVHRRTSVPFQLAGFNLGQYQSTSISAGPYRIDTYAENEASARMNGVPQQAARILAYYNQRWMPLAYHSLAITPVPGYFGQGFPGLIYLSNVAYIRPEDRPPQLRGGRSEDFFSELLLPHEVAHQWWGNLITSANYRSGWLMEAMANYAALEFVDRSDPDALNRILETYRHDLLETSEGKRTEQVGPVDFGIRILQNAGEKTWQAVVYGKGSWILHMLHQRLGETAFHELQQRTLATYAGKAITNEEFRAVAAEVGHGGPDKSFTKFFETWVYGTGIPVLSLKGSSDEWTVDVEGTEEGFTADLPLRCKATRKSEPYTRWAPIVAGENIVAKHQAEVCELPRITDFLYTPKP